MTSLWFGFGPSRHLAFEASGNTGTGTTAQPVSLLTSTGTAANNVYAFPGGIAPIASATLTQTMVPTGATMTLHATVGGLPIPAASVLLIAWGGYIQAFQTTAPANGGDTSITIAPATPNFAYPSGTVLAVSTLLPYVQFPATPPAQVTGTPGMVFILHNWAFQTPVQAWLLKSDGTPYAGTGGGLCRLEPGARTQPGTTSYGAVCQTVPGNPTPSMRIAFQNFVTTEAGGFNIAVNAWMA